MSAVEQTLPGLDGALVPGPIFFEMTLLGDPQHKGRHRSRIVRPKVGAPFIHNYPDPKTEKYEKTLAHYAALKMGPKQPADGPLCLLVIVDRYIPVSWSRADRTAAMEGRVLPTSKPDGDNYLKVVQDALNEVVWFDDSQIIDARIIKRYSTDPAMTMQVRKYVSPI